jgi:hypothetical protein
MSDIAEQSFVRQELVSERAAPIKTTGFVGFLRTRLFNSPTNILLTIASALLLWFTVIPTLKFLLIDAVWTGTDRNACLAENAGHVVGACWPYVQAKFTQFIYGFYPEPERWRVNLTFVLAALLLLPLLIPRLPAKGLNAGLFFVAFPIVAFFLLHGGGLSGFGVSWVADLLAGLVDDVGAAGQKLAGAGGAAPLLGKLVTNLGQALVYVISPLTWLRDQIQMSSRPLWADFAVTAAIVSALMFFLGGGIRSGWRALIVSLSIFVGIAIVIAAMGLDHGGLPIVDTRLWPFGDAGGVGHRYRDVDASRHCASLGAALDHPLDPHLLDRLYRVLARRAFDHGIVLRDLHAAAVPSRGFYRGWLGAGADRHRAVCRRLYRRGDPRRPAGDPARAGRSRQRAGPVLGQNDRANRDAAGAAARHSRPRQQLHRVVQGYLAGLDRGIVRSARQRAGLVFRSGVVDADHLVHRICLRRNDLLRVLLWNVALFIVRRTSAQRTPPQLN